MLLKNDGLITALHLGPVTIKRPTPGGTISAYEEERDGGPILVWFAVADTKRRVIQRVNAAYVHIVDYE